MNLKFNITLFYPSPPNYSQNCLSILFFLFKISEKKIEKKEKWSEFKIVKQQLISLKWKRQVFFSTELDYFYFLNKINCCVKTPKIGNKAPDLVCFSVKMS